MLANVRGHSPSKQRIKQDYVMLKEARLSPQVWVPALCTDLLQAQHWCQQHRTRKQLRLHKSLPTSGFRVYPTASPFRRFLTSNSLSTSHLQYHDVHKYPARDGGPGQRTKTRT